MWRAAQSDAAETQPGQVQLAPILMPLNPEVIQQYQRAGKKVPLSMTEARFAGKPEVTINRIHREPLLPTTQTLKAIVILVKFQDDPPGGPTTRLNPTVWDNMLFGDTYIRSGSHPADTTTIRTLKRFYNTVSYGNIDIVTLNLPSSVG